MYIIHIICKHKHNVHGVSTLSRLLRLGVSKTKCVGWGGGGDLIETTEAGGSKDSGSTATHNAEFLDESREVPCLTIPKAVSQRD